MTSNNMSQRNAYSGAFWYWLLRSFTFFIAASLGLYLLTAFVWIPFYSSEGYTLQFADRILGFIGDVLLFIAIVIPHRWTLSSPRYELRIGLIVFAVLWIVIVDVVAYVEGLSTTPLSPHDFIALLIGIALYSTLTLLRKRAIEQALAADSPVSGLYS